MAERTVKMRVILKRLVSPESGAIVGRDVEFMATEREAAEMAKAGQAEVISETASVKAPKSSDPKPAEGGSGILISKAVAPPPTTKETKKTPKKK